MDSRLSLESLLQILLDNSEKKALVKAAVELLREVCSIHTEHSEPKLQNTAEQAQQILDYLLLDKEARFDAEEITEPPKTAIEKSEKISVPEKLAPQKQTEKAAAKKQPQKQTEKTGKSASVEKDEIITEKNNSCKEKRKQSKLKKTVRKRKFHAEEGEFPESEHLPAVDAGEQAVKEDLSADTYETIHEEKYVVPKAKTPLQKSIHRWNEKVGPWLQVQEPASEDADSLISLVKAAAVVRNNLVSAKNFKGSHQKTLKRFARYWQQWQEEIGKLDYEVFPRKFGAMEVPSGDVIHTCRVRLERQEHFLLLPGLKKHGNTLLTPLSLTVLPSDQAFPANHPHYGLAPQWRGILGDLEVLCRLLEIQPSVSCAIENINKTSVVPLGDCRENTLNEIKRRGKALGKTVHKNENIYRLATDYWRVEECFWGIFHNDDRPPGYSFFDHLRRRIQGWRITIRKENKLFIRDFSAGSDSLASISKYIGNIILDKQKEMPPGVVIRELRPAIVVKVNKVTRVLKGRVISS